MDQVIRGILKTERRADANKKKIHFDKYNVMQTMRLTQRTDNVETPITVNDENHGNLDIPTLMKQLNIASDSAFFNIPEDSEDSSADDDDEFPELIQEKVRRLEFTRRRKMHYKEYFTVPVARQLIHEELNDLECSGESKNFTTNSQISPNLSCSLEFCESNESLGKKATESSIQLSSSLDNDTLTISDIVVEPGFDSNHRCYQTLMADSSQVNLYNSI